MGLIHAFLSLYFATQKHGRGVTLFEGLRLSNTR